MGSDEGFLEGIRAAPADLALRLVYADWLDGRGDERGEYLRIQAKLLEAARKRKSNKEVQEMSWEVGSWLKANSPEEYRRHEKLLNEGKAKLVEESGYSYGRRRLNWQQLTSREQRLRIEKLIEATGASTSVKKLQAKYNKLHSVWSREPSPDNYYPIQAMLLEAAGAGRSTKALQLRYKQLRKTLDGNWLEATNWPLPRPKSSIRCIFGAMHRWDGCVCSRCDAVSHDDMRHAWVGCKCIRCGQTTETIADRVLTSSESEAGWHELAGCQCSVCGAVRHDLVPLEPDDGSGDRICVRCGVRGWGWV